MKFADAFNEKKVLITGHTGFKGAWLAFWLHSLGAKVIGFSLPPPTFPSVFEQLRIYSQIIHIEGDINNYEHLRSVIKQYQPEIIFHLAAQPIVLESYRHPLATIQTNVMGTVHLLEILRSSPCTKVCVLATSDKCYEKQDRIQTYGEQDSLGGADPYSASKGAVEILISSYYRSFFSPKDPYQPSLGIATVRAGNVIGGGDWGTHRLIPDSIRSLNRKEPIVLRNPHFYRPWQHVLEALSGYLLLGKSLLEDPSRYSGPWNFGPPSNEVVSVKNLVQLLIQISKADIPIMESTEGQLFEDRYLYLNCEKAQTFLNWKTLYTIEERVEKTWRWYEQAISNPKELDRLTLEQIKDYEFRLKHGSNVPASALPCL